MNRLTRVVIITQDPEVAIRLKDYLLDQELKFLELEIAQGTEGTGWVRALYVDGLFGTTQGQSTDEGGSHGTI